MKKILKLIIIIYVFVFFSIPATTFNSAENRIRVIIFPPEEKKPVNTFFTTQIINSLEKNFEIEYIRDFKNGIISYIGKDRIELLKKLGFKVYKDFEVEAFLTESVPLIKANSVWRVILNEKNITGKGISVCVIDTGVDYTHPDLGGCFGNGVNFSCKVIAGYDFVNSDSDPMDDNGHGTHVAGIIAANGTLKGVAPDAKIIAVKVLDANGNGYLTDIVSGIEWCINRSSEYNISIISMSLGTKLYHNDTYCDDDFRDPYFLTETIDEAVSKGISVVVATGNEGVTNGTASPACIYNSTRVSATNKSDIIPSFANRGGNFDIILMAPGVDISSTWIGGGYTYASGTSMATPHVSGVVALMKQVNNILFPKEIEKILNETGKVIYDPASGKYYSRIDAYKAISKLIVPNLFSPNVSPYFGNTSTLFNFTVNYTRIANIPPFYVKLCINNSCFNTTSNDNDYTNGAIFYYSTNLSYGIYAFFFEVFDGTNNISTPLIQGPWVADEFWINNTTQISQTKNLTKKYIISNTSLVNITSTLILSNSHLNMLNNAELVNYGNLTLNSSNITKVLKISSYGNLFISNLNSSSEIIGYSGVAEIRNSSFSTIHVKTNSTLKNVNVTQLKITLEFDSVIKDFPVRGKIITAAANISLENVNASSLKAELINSNSSISNSTLNLLYLNNSHIEVDSSYFNSVYISGNSSIKGYVSIGNISIQANSSLKRYFPIKLVRDIEENPVDRNITTWKNTFRYNFSTKNGFVWISEVFYTGGEQYLIWIDNYGFAQINASNITISAQKNTTKNITLDVVFPFVQNFTISEKFISPGSSLGKKDNTTISFNESEQLAEKCIIVKISALTVNEICRNNSYVWDGRNKTGDILSDGNYSIWLKLTDFFGNENLTNIFNITVDNTKPAIKINISSSIVINGTSVNISVIVSEPYVNTSLINISSPMENISLQFKNILFLQLIPNYTGNYTIEVISKDLAENLEISKRFIISRPETKINLTAKAPSPVNISVIYENYVINETTVFNKSILSLPEWVFDIKVKLNRSLEILLKNVNVSVNKNSSVRIETPEIAGYLKAYAVETTMNFTNASVVINYTDSAYTNENYLGVYRCDIWNFTENTCESGWTKINALIDKNLKSVKFYTSHFSAFAIKQEPYCGDGVVNQESEDCDISDFAGKTCKSFGYDYGTLSCTSDCKIITSGCGYYSTSPSQTSSFSSVIQVETCKNLSESCSSNSECCSNYCFNGKCSEKILNIIIECPHSMEVEEGNVSISVDVKNTGTISANSYVLFENYNKSVFLLPGEEKNVVFEIFTFPGERDMKIYTLNDSCTIRLKIFKSKLRKELESKISLLKEEVSKLEESKRINIIELLSLAETKLNNNDLDSAKEIINRVESIMKNLEKEGGKSSVLSLLLLFALLIIFLIGLSILYKFKISKLIVTRNAEKSILQIEKILVELENKGVDVSEIRKELENAKNAIKEGMPHLARVHITRIENMLKNIEQ